MALGDTRYCVCGCGQPAKRYVTNGKFTGWRAYAAGHAPREVNVVIQQADPGVLGYAAGIIDGEGCIFAKAFLRKDGSFQTMIQVQVAMCSASVIKWLRDCFGGRVYTDVPTKGHVAYKRRYLWQVSGKRVGELLPMFLPYLIEKHQRALLAIQLAGMMTGAPGWKTKMPDDERERRMQMAAQIKAFNRRTSGEDIVV